MKQRLNVAHLPTLQLMCELGNSVINHIYEGSYLDQGLKKPLPSSSR